MGKISALSAFTGTGAAANDVLPYVDVSASTAGSKKITLAELLNALGTVNAAGTALTGANTATNDQYAIWDVSASAFKYQTAAELLQGLGVTIAAASALTGANHAVGDLFFVYDLSATAIKSVTAPELLNVIASATINATAMTTGFHATQDFFHYSDNGVAKSITVPYLANALGALTTTALAGASWAVDDTLLIYDLSATTLKAVTTAELLNGICSATINATAMTGSGAHVSQDFLLYSDNGVAKSITMVELTAALFAGTSATMLGSDVTPGTDNVMVSDGGVPKKMTFDELISAIALNGFLTLTDIAGPHADQAAAATAITGTGKLWYQTTTGLLGITLT